MLLSSSDRSVVERVEKALVASGIACDLRSEPLSSDGANLPFYSELWVNEAEEFPLASMLSASRLVR